MLVIPDSRHRGDGSIHQGSDTQHHLPTFPIRSRAPTTRAIRATSRARPRRTSSPPASPTPRSSDPSRNFSSSTASATTPTQHSSYYYIESNEGAWNSGKGEGGANLGYKSRYKEGYFPVPPNDTLQDIRTEMVLEMERVGIRVEKQHHEVATAGQAEIDMRFQSLVKMADSLTWYKYICKNVAWRHGKTGDLHAEADFSATTAPACIRIRALEGRDAAVRGHPATRECRSSRCTTSRASCIMRQSIAAFTNPGTNSYRRLVPGFEAPINLAYSSRNRSASVRIPMYSPSPKAKRIEVRFPDPTCNPYLAFSAMLMAGLDGIQRRLDPGQPLDKDIYALTPAELKEVPSMPASLEESLEQPQEGSRVPAEGRRLHRGPDRDLDRLQDGERSERDSAAAASVRVRAVLRRVSTPLRVDQNESGGPNGPPLPFSEVSGQTKDRCAIAKPEPASLTRSCPRSVPPVAIAPVVRMTRRREAVRDPSCR